MLRLLTVENFALIEHLELEFGEGLNLLTGETGSGKSILVDALGLLLGRRASQEMIREGCQQSRVEGLFELPSDHPARTHLEESGIDVDQGQLIIRRDMSVSGSNRVYLNGVLTTLGLLSELGVLLADVHGQHDQQKLLQPREHLHFLDAFAGTEDAAQTVAGLHKELQDVERRLAQIAADERDRLRRIDTIVFQIGEIDNLKLAPGIDEKLKEERQLLGSAEKRFEASSESYRRLYEADDAVVASLQRIRRTLEAAEHLDPVFSQAVEKVAEIQFQLEELAYELRDYKDSVEFNPRRLEMVEERLAEILRVCRKYGDSVEQVLQYRDDLQGELDALSQQKELTEKLSQHRQDLAARYRQAARDLSSNRSASSGKLCRRVEQELADLAMSSTRFAIDMRSDEDAGGEQGIDELEFLISANPGESPRSLAKIASGGELSRIILALKSILTLENYAKTLVFDEVDAGLGGRVASALGEKLSRLSQSHQVFCVTHLPQIAARASHHYRVDKMVSGSRTIVRVEHLRDSERIQELARMLAGKTVTESAIEQARTLLAGT